MYIGGTTAAIPANSLGPLSTDDSKQLSFRWAKNSASWQLAYGDITSLAYGQHAGRRVGAAIAWGVTTLGVMALPILLSKKRRHYLTIEYKDSSGQSQAAIFEVGKDAIRTMLTSLEVRTGLKVSYEDDEARKAGNK